MILNIFLRFALLLQPLFMYLQAFLGSLFGLFLKTPKMLITIFEFFQSGLWMIIERIIGVGSTFFSLFRFMQFFKGRK